MQSGVHTFPEVKARNGEQVRYKTTKSTFKRCRAGSRAQDVTEPPHESVLSMSESPFDSGLLSESDAQFVTEQRIDFVKNRLLSIGDFTEP